MSLIPVRTAYDLRLTTYDLLTTTLGYLGTNSNWLAGKTPESQGQTGGTAVVDRSRTLAPSYGL